MAGAQVHGTCLGFEALAVVVSGNDTILGKCAAGSSRQSEGPGCVVTQGTRHSFCRLGQLPCNTICSRCHAQQQRGGCATNIGVEQLVGCTPAQSSVLTMTLTSARFRFNSENLPSPLFLTDKASSSYFWKSLAKPIRHSLVDKPYAMENHINGASPCTGFLALPCNC